MALSLQQIGWDGLTFGRPGPFRIVALTGLRSTPELRSDRIPRPRQPGAFPSVDEPDGRTIVATIQARLAGDAAEWADLEAVADPATGPLSLRIKGVAGGRELIVPAAQFQGFSGDLDPASFVGASRFDAEWWCPDPLLYDAAGFSATTSRADAGGGLVFPLTDPLDFGSAPSGGSVTVTNDGNTPTPWVATFTGPITNPRLINQTTGASLRFTGTIPAGQTLVVDSAARTALLNGTSDRTWWKAVGSTWWQFAKGSNVVQFAAGAGTGSVTITGRSAWLL